MSSDQTVATLLLIVLHSTAFANASFGRESVERDGRSIRNSNTLTILARITEEGYCNDPLPKATKDTSLGKSVPSFLCWYYDFALSTTIGSR